MARFVREECNTVHWILTQTISAVAPTLFEYSVVWVWPPAELANAQTAPVQSD